MPRTARRTTTRTTQARAPKRAQAPAWTVLQVTPDDYTAPCWAVARGSTLIYVGPSQGPAAHVYRRTADRLCALAQAEEAARAQVTRRGSRLHTPAQSHSSRHS